MRALGAALFLVAAPALARDSRLPLDNKLQPVTKPARMSIGLLLGDPTGLSFKRYLSGSDAWDVNFAFAYGPGLRFSADYLFGLGRLEHHPKFDVDLYAGGGPVLGVLNGPCGPGFLDNRCNGDVYAGFRVPIGIELFLTELPMVFGVEVAPGMGFAPGRAGLLLDVLMALRFVF